MTKLRPFGVELALILDRETLKTYGIDEYTSLEVVVDETGIHVRPEAENRETKVHEAALRVMENHDETFRKLAL